MYHLQNCSKYIKELRRRLYKCSEYIRWMKFSISALACYAYLQCNNQKEMKTAPNLQLKINLMIFWELIPKSRGLVTSLLTLKKKKFGPAESEHYICWIVTTFVEEKFKLSIFLHLIGHTELFVCASSNQFVQATMVIVCKHLACNGTCLLLNIPLSLYCHFVSASILQKKAGSV